MTEKSRRSVLKATGALGIGGLAAVASTPASAANDTTASFKNNGAADWTFAFEVSDTDVQTYDGTDSDTEVSVNVYDTYSRIAGRVAPGDEAEVYYDGDVRLVELEGSLDFSLDNESGSEATWEITATDSTDYSLCADSCYNGTVSGSGSETVTTSGALVSFAGALPNGESAKAEATR